jgi:predicted CXXCH cytochrome family protein
MRPPRRTEPAATAAARAAVVLLIAAAMLLPTGCGREEAGANGPAAKPVTPVAQRPVEPAPRPTGPLPEGTSCMTAECHADFGMASFIHGPVSAGECGACHGPDTGDHQFPLVRDPVETCTFCHAVSGSAPHQHAALEEGCTACHQPHASHTKFLLNAISVQMVCESCHDVSLKQFAHRPFLEGQCTLCHQPHQSANNMLLRGGEGAAHCAMCHGPMVQAIGESPHQHEPAVANCTSCHSPHTTNEPHLLAGTVEQTCYSCHEQIAVEISEASLPHEAVHMGEQCANCHNPHASSQSQLLRDRMDRMCLSCHGQPQQTPDGRTVEPMRLVLEESQFLHGPIRQGDCSSCHAAHGGEREGLLTAAFPDTFYTSFEIGKYELCFTCHDQNLVTSDASAKLTNFRDGEVNLHYLHVNRSDKGRTCRTCHDVHGSDQPYHMAETVRFEGSRWDMPIRYVQTSDGGSCAPGCHAPKRFSRDGVSATAVSETGGMP